MEFRRIQALRGPNVWAMFPVLEATVDLAEHKDARSHELPEFTERLLGWLPSLRDHSCSLERPCGFVERLHRGADLARVLEHVAIELQSLAGTPVGFGCTRETAEDGVFRVVLKYQEEELGEACLKTARDLCLAAVADRPFDVNAEIGRLRDLAHDVCLGPSTASIVEAARSRGIPTSRLSTANLVQLGQGARQRRIWTAETDQTSAIAESIAQDKELTRTLLKAVGVPVPEGRPVTDPDDAWDAACEIGLPVVVKPRDGNQGRGVATNLTTREQVMGAYASAHAISSAVLVEKYAPGADHRVLVVNSRVVAAARREPAQVVGDGRSTIAQLVAVVNRDPRRSDGHATALSKIYLDEIALAVLSDQGYTPEDVPPAGQKVLIRRNANLSTGGTATDVTDQVHPELAARAIEAAQAVGLDIAGIDVVALDISRPLEEQHGVIVEVNAGPGLRMHLEPSAGKPRPVGEAIVSMLFPEGETGRIPLVSITGTNGKTTTTRCIAHMLASEGRTVGMTCTDGIYVRGRLIEKGDCSGPQSARTVLVNPRVDAAVLEVARGGILRAGLGFDRCDVAVVTNIGEGDHLGLAGIETPADLARVKRTIVESVATHGWAVLNAADPLVAAMAPFCPGQVVFFAKDGAHPVLAQHRQRGGRTVYVQDGTIMLAEGTHQTPLMSLARVPLTHRGRVGFQVENALAAAAAGWSLGLPAEVLRSGLETFTSDARQVPGRFNVFHANGATIIVDYGHNPSSLDALVQALDGFPHKSRAIVYTVAGDRRDIDVVRQGEQLAAAFDRVHIYEDQCTRGRRDGEIVGLMRSGLVAGSRVREITETRGEMATIELAFRSLRAGELLVVQPDAVEESLQQVQRLIDSGFPRLEEQVPELVEIAHAAAPDLEPGDYAAQAWEQGQLMLKQ